MLAAMAEFESRLGREFRTLEAMVRLYCRDHHPGAAAPPLSVHVDVPPEVEPDALVDLVRDGRPGLRSGFEDQCVHVGDGLPGPQRQLVAGQLDGQLQAIAGS